MLLSSLMLRYENILEPLSRARTTRMLARSVGLAGLWTRGDRSAERYRGIFYSGAAAAAAKGMTALTAFFAIPVAIRYLGPERYGMWMSITTIGSLLVFADFGIGNGLVNTVAATSGHEDHQRARATVSTAVIMLIGLAICGLAVCGLASKWLPWHALFNVKSELAVREACPAAMALIATYFVRLPLSVGQQIQRGYQETFLSSAWDIAATLGGFAALLAAIHLRLGLPCLVLATTGTVALSALANSVVQFAVVRPWLSPSLLLVNWKEGKALMRSSALLMIWAICSLIGTASDNLVIARYLGSEAVATYSVVQRLFLVATAAQWFIAPLWPALTEALSRGDYKWARGAVRKTLRMGIIGTAALSLPMLVFAPKLLLWFHPSLSAPLHLLIVTVLWRISEVVVAVLIVTLNQPATLAYNVLAYGTASAVAIVLKFTLVNAFGITGAVLSSLLGYGIVYGLLGTCMAKRLLAQSAYACD